ncbi:XdhC family protein [soil metagenome]
MIERSLVEAAARLRRHGEPYVVATVVRARRPGARMILTRYRWLAGTVSGGGFEGELASSAWMHTKDAGPVVLTYDAHHPDIGGDDDLRAAFGLGDGESVDVMLERAGAPGRLDVLELAARCSRQQKRGAAATVIRSEGSAVKLGMRLALVAGGEIEQEQLIDSTLRDEIATDLRVVLETGCAMTRSFGAFDVLSEAIEPPPRLFVFGSGHDLVPLAQLARQIGWDVVICGEATRYSTRERFVMADEILTGDLDSLAERINESERAVCVVATHDADKDRAILAMLGTTKACYIGVVGSGARHALDDHRVRELLGDSPQDRAFAAIGESQAVLRRMPGAPTTLPERPVPSRPSAAFAAVVAL